MSGNGAKIRVRIAPSPTGPLHLGTARSAFFNFVYAKQNGGEFILRIEDTDIKRSDPIFEKDITDGLSWLGIKWDEFYRQSDRLDIYEKYLKKLLDSSFIFWCPHSEEELSAERHEQMGRKTSPAHRCDFRDGSSGPECGKSILRFKNDFDGDIFFDDLIRGSIAFAGKILGDFSVAKDLRTPLYNLAVVVDDYETAITHVIRGEDHISNTPKQILLQNALGFSRPKYAHLPLILGTDRSKLSKRHGAASVLEYQKSGYLPEAMINFMILLGWHSADENEILGMPEIMKNFSLDRVQKGGAVFNLDKLKWLNGEYIKKLEKEDLASRLKDFVPEFCEEIAGDPKKWLKISEVLRERLVTLGEAGEMAEYFYKEPYYSKELLSWKESQTAEDILRHLKYTKEVLEKLPDFKPKELEGVLMPYAEKEGRGEVLWPFRTALSGRRASAGPFEIAGVLGKEETIKRLQKAIEILS